MTNSLYLQNFIEALNRWSEEVKEKTIIKRTMFFIGFDLGLEVDEQEDIEKIKNRLEFLIENANINDEYLILSLVDRVSYHLKRELATHGEAIILNEKLINKNKDSESGVRVEVMERTLSILKERTYVLKHEEAIDYWERIRSEIFTLSNIRKWKDFSNDR